MLKKFLIGTFVVAGLAMAMSASAAYDFGSTTLRVGSKGPAVMAVQTVVGATVDGSFGPMTKAKVMAWQAANGLVADGVFGNMSKAKANAGSVVVGTYPAGCTSSVGYSSTTGQKCDATVSTGLPAGCTSTVGYSATTGAKCDGSTTGAVDTGPLVGTDGTLATVTKLSQYNAEEVGAGQNDVKVLGFDVKASKDGDIELKSIKLAFAITNASGSTRLEDYVDSVSVWMGSTKVGTADATDFNKDSTGNYSKVVTLSGAVSRKDVTNKIYVTVDAVSNLDSGDIDSEVMTISVDNIRYVDGSGVVSTDTTTGDLDSTLDSVSIAMVSYSSAADTELKASLDSSSPENGIVIVSTTATTEDVVLLKGKLKLEGTGDATLNTLPITLTSTTSGTASVADIVSSLRLKLGSEEFTESTSAVTTGTGTVTFDNLDFDIAAGETVSFTVYGDIADIDGTVFKAGDTITATLSSTNRNEMDVENAEGDQLADASEKSGTITGGTLEFRANGPQLTLVSATAVSSNSTTNDQDTGTYVIKFSVKAIGDTIYVATTASTAGAVNNVYAVDISGTSTLTDVSGIITNVTDSDLVGGLWEIAEDQTETLEMTVLRSPSSEDGLFRAALSNIKWNTTGSTTTFNTYSSNLDSFKTPYISLD
ncbi:MAG TPA: peptidoglycan-binding domain-containing protein [Candidatus Paceibacterota bacterium]|nr:peptidoglycan-binding domain-containing protein [Candidatus Paceibacterota bacterium]